VKKFSLISNLNLPWHNLRPFPLVLSLVTREKRPTPPFSHLNKKGFCWNRNVGLLVEASDASAFWWSPLRLTCCPYAVTWRTEHSQTLGLFFFPWLVTPWMVSVCNDTATGTEWPWITKWGNESSFQSASAASL